MAYRTPSSAAGLVHLTFQSLGFQREPPFARTAANGHSMRRLVCLIKTIPLRRLRFVRSNPTQTSSKRSLRAIRRGDAQAIAELNAFHPLCKQDGNQLADAQHALARSYGAASWPRLVQSCNLIAAIWQDDLEPCATWSPKPNLLHENAGIRNTTGSTVELRSNLRPRFA